MDDYTKEFLIEVGEALASLDNDLVRLEAEPTDRSLIAGIFRTVHTIKGTCGFLGLSKLGHIAHAGENVLGQIRDGTLAPDPHVVSVILRCVDAIKVIVTTIEATGQEGEETFDDVVAELDMLLGRSVPVLSGETHGGAGDSDALQALFDATPVEEPAPPTPVHETPVAEARRAAEPPAEARGTAESSKEASAVTQTVRVRIDLLEGLMATVSELVLSRNQLLQLLRGEKDSPFQGPLQRLSMITSELQESVMKTRMQPIGNAWSALPRIVRDLAMELGKKIDLIMEGAETELDRQVLELIKDPLTHMIRNAADHGLEMPLDRQAAGKSATGRIVLSAYHEGGHIVIRIADDGKGMDAARLRAKAVESGLATHAEAAAMSDANVFRFIMQPGFSTAAKVTAISGRGVGMDVVRTNIEKIGGVIDIESQPGFGSTFIIKIPLTLAIIPALIVGCAGERFAIPQISVIELVRIAKTGDERIGRVSNSEVFRLRDRLLPLVDLQPILGLPPTGFEQRERLIIVTQLGSRFFGICVDEVFDTEEIVVKPVSPVLKNLGVYSGNTILGDGSICMIIDPNGIASRIGQVGASSETKNATDTATDRAGSRKNAVRLLLVKAGMGLRKAIPLDLVARLEDIDVNAIHRTDDGRLLVQYRNGLMRLVPAAAGVSLKDSGRQSVLVCGDSDEEESGEKSRQIGLLVDDILDIIEHSVDVEIESSDPDMLGSAVIGGVPTEVLNISSVIRRGGMMPSAMAEFQFEETV